MDWLKYIKSIHRYDRSPLSPGSSHEKMNKTLANFFDKIEGANIETNTEAAKVMIEDTKLDYDESIISLDVKSLYKNISLKAIDII